MTRVFCNDAVERIEAKRKNTLAGMSEGDELDAAGCVTTVYEVAADEHDRRNDSGSRTI